MTNLPRPKLLVVDDTPANLLVMRRLLAKVDAELIEARDGTEALRACLDHEFALILLDVNMPEMDGFEAASLIAEEEKNRLTPIIFVTAAYGDDTHRLKGYHSGAVDYIAKPINDQILRSKVMVFVELWQARQSLVQLSNELQERNQQLQHEVAERERAEAEARYLAQHDALTGLPNRILFIDRLDTAITRAARHGEPTALLYIDIDGFKPVNDKHGHTAGDALLRQIGQRLCAGVRSSDTVSRLGGDEFAVVLEEISDLTEARQIAEQLRGTLATPFVLERDGTGITVNVGGSIGIALFPDHAAEREALISAADEAMYAAKKRGKNHCLSASDLTTAR